MSTALTPVDLTQLPSTQVGDDQQFVDASRRSAFLSRLHLFSKGEAIDECLIPPGHYGIPESKKEIIKLGPQVDILPLAKRLKALDMSDKQAIINNYDPASQEYADIKARSTQSNSGCLWGTSFLVFERESGRFLEFFCGTVSSRPIAGDIAVYLPLTQADIDRKRAAGADTSHMEPHFAEACTLKTRIAKSVKKGFSWHVPDVHPCSVPFTNLPSSEVIIEEIRKFTNPPKSEVETVTEEPKNARAR